MSVIEQSPALRSMLSDRANLAAGQPIADLMAVALANPNLISLAAGFVDPESLPVDITSQALQAVLGRKDLGQTALQYGTTSGYEPLRDAVLDWTWKQDQQAASENSIGSLQRPRPGVDQVIMTAGSNELLYLLTDVLCNPGDIILCTAPTYFVYLGILKNLGVRSWGIETDEHGPIPESLESQLHAIAAAGELHRVKGVYIVSYFDNPAGTTTSLERRREILGIVQHWSKHGKIRILEDAAYRELRYTAMDIPSFLSLDTSGETVIHTQTFSKSFSPGVRVGWGILPDDLVKPVWDQKGNIDFGSAHFNQVMMAQVLSQGNWPAHLATIRRRYAEKCSAMVDACTAHLADLEGVSFRKPAGGLYVWLQLPGHLSTGLKGRLFQRCVQEGVLVVPGEYSFPECGTPGNNSCMRLSFGVQTPQRIDTGISLLAAAIRAELASSRR